MIITRRSQYSGKINQLDLPITAEQISKFETGQGLVQDIFPNLSPDEREFIKTGIMAEEWDELFSPS